MVRLNNVKVRSISYGESVLSVKLELSSGKRVITNVERTRVTGRVSVVRPSVSSTGNISIELKNPDKFLARVVKSELGLNS